jgi:hypothetical protein
VYLLSRKSDPRPGFAKMLARSFLVLVICLIFGFLIGSMMLR